jgi:hypothetical protein
MIDRPMPTNMAKTSPLMKVPAAEYQLQPETSQRGSTLPALFDGHEHEGQGAVFHWFGRSLANRGPKRPLRR